MKTNEQIEYLLAGALRRGPVFSPAFLGEHPAPVEVIEGALTAAGAKQFFCRAYVRLDAKTDEMPENVKQHPAVRFILGFFKPGVYYSNVHVRAASKAAGVSWGTFTRFLRPCHVVFRQGIFWAQSGSKYSLEPATRRNESRYVAAA